jgi:pSer/pThr/pTyr-binding forkhead associated (FHA) protein
VSQPAAPATKPVLAAAAPIVVRFPGSDRVLQFIHPFRIGRAADNDIVFDEEAVSQYHAEVVCENGQWWLRDLQSTNGTVVGGTAVERLPIVRTTLVRFGPGGPAIVVAPEGATATPRATTSVAPNSGGDVTDSAVMRRYFAPRAPGQMSRHTAAVRRVIGQHRRQYVWALIGLAALGAAASWYAYVQRRHVQRQRAAAADLFYAMKGLELEVDRLAASAEELRSYHTQRDALQRQYADFVEQLGIYGSGTPDRVRVVYEVIHRFGESEVNIPREFVDQVLRFVDRWKRNTELDEAVLRAEEHGYGKRIAEIMLENGMPPEFFYLAVQESRLKVEAVGPRTRVGYAKGMWQIIPGTAREYGLKTGPLVGQPRADAQDERQDFEKATRAAAQHLRRLYRTDAQASGLLVMAAYNWGQGNALRLIRSLPANPRQRNYWTFLSRFKEEIPQETRNYVLAIVAAAAIGENPKLFGFVFDPPLPPPEPVTE